MTVFTRSAFIFSESSYFNLKFGHKSVESLPRNGHRKLKSQDPLMNRQLKLFVKYTNLELAYCFIKVHSSVLILVKLKKTKLFFLVIKLTKPFAVPNACAR